MFTPLLRSVTAANARSPQYPIPLEHYIATIVYSGYCVALICLKRSCLTLATLHEHSWHYKAKLLLHSFITD